MRFLYSVKVLKYGCLAAIGLAATITAIAALSSPAAAQGGGGGDSDEYPWDTDNLKIGSTYTARSFAIPHYSFAGTDAGNARAGNIKIGEVRYPYANVWPCQSGVMDGFFQNQASQPRNDLPKLEKTAGVWGETSGHSCSGFRQAQDVAVSAAGGNGGYWLDSSGNLKQGGFGSWMSVARTAGDDVLSSEHVTWANKGGGYSVVRVNNNFQIQVVAPSATDEGYIARIDYGAASPGGTDVRTVGAPAQGLSLPQTPVREGYIAPGETPKTYRGAYSATRHGSGSIARRHLPHAQSVGGGTGSLCPAGSHPRGEDSLYRIGSGTGRTLTSLSSDMKSRLADAFWCRSDIRYAIRYAPNSIAGTTCGTGGGAPSCPSDVTIPTGNFKAWGRVNCYYTALEIDSTGKCVYPHPVPSCADSDTGTARYFTATELATYTTDTVPFPAESDGSTTCAASATPAPTPGDPPALADFTADACVTADLEIAENRIAGSDAEPGVRASDRTLTTGTSLPPAWDLDVTSPHPKTASPPRGAGDPSGCADGSEDREAHAVAPGAAERSQTSAQTYASSSSTDTTAPPNDSDGDIDYSGAAANMAHRYASRIAENTCAAKRAEADLRLALLEAEAEIYKDWIGRYGDWAKGRKEAFASWRPTGYPAGTTPDTSASSHATFNSFKHAVRSQSRLAYASGMSSMYAARETAAGTAAATVLAKPTVGTTWCGSPSSFAQSYQTAVTNLKTAFGTALVAGGATPASPTAGPTSTVSLNSGNGGFVVSSELTAGSAAVPEIKGRSYTLTYRNSEGDEETSTTTCLGFVPSYSGVTVTDNGECTLQAGSPEVIASGSASSVSYPSYSFTLSGGGWSRTVTVPSATGTAVCTSWRTSSCFARPFTHPGHSRSVSQARGSLPSVANFPALVSPSFSAGSPAVSSLLGEYHPRHATRTDLENPAASVRDQAAKDLGTLTIANAAATTPTAFANIAVPADNPAEDSTETAQRNAVRTAATTYQNAYTQAYDNAFTQATGHMSGTAWESFDWRYEGSTLDWGGYQEDPKSPPDGCDLINIAADGTVTVQATRLDFETSSFGKGSVFGVRAEAQRTCKIRRVRSPELLLEYQPSASSGTDSSKAASFWHVNYQPTADAERFKLYDEAEVFAVLVSLADRTPVLCYQPGEALVAHVGAKGIDAVNKAVFRNGSGFSGGNKKHCFRYPSVTRPAFAFFDDTAHSALSSVSVVWQPPATKIVSKLGSSDDLKMMGNSVSLVRSTEVPYNDTTRTSSFYGFYYTFPADASTKSPSGWDILKHPTLTLASTFRQHEVQAKDSASTPATTHTMVFKFIDCVFGIEDVAFVDNIASPYAFLSENGTVRQGWKQTYDSDPHSSPTWYYPPFSTYQGTPLQPERLDSDNNPITYRRNPQGGFPHPSNGIGWGILYENTVGKQQPVWAVYAPPVPGDNTQLAQEVCGGSTLDPDGTNPMPTTTRRIGTPATPPPATGNWTWKNTTWNYQDNPIMLWSVDDDPAEPWETKTSPSDTLPRKPHNNLELATQYSSAGDIDVFNPSSKLLEDQDMVLANFAMVTLADLESELRERAEKGGITCGSNWWYCFRPAPAGYRLWGKEWMSKRQLCIGFNFKLNKWSSTTDDALASTLDNDRNERSIPIRLRLGYIAGGIPTLVEPHHDSRYESSTIC